MTHMTYEDEWNEQQEKDKRYEEQQKKKRQRAYQKKKIAKGNPKLVAKAKEELPPIIGWILCSPKALNNYNEHVRKAILAKPKDMPSGILVDTCIDMIIEKNIHFKIPWDNPFSYVAAVLHNTILPELKKKYER